MKAAESATGIELRTEPEGGVLVVLTGTLDVRTAGAARRDLLAKLSGLRPTSLCADASALSSADVSGMEVLWELSRGIAVPGVRATIRGLPPQLATILAAYPSPEEVEAATAQAPPPPGLHALGAGVLSIVGDLHEQLEFVGEVALGIVAGLRHPRAMRWGEVRRVIERAGLAALPIVLFVGLLTGLIIAFEAAQPLKLLGAELFVANTIGIIVLRELGPLMTAIVVAGRSGPSLAAELGMMKVNEELDALETMGLSPLRYLVVQRVVAGTVLTPALTVFSMAVGVLGGMIVMLMLGFPLAIVWNQLVLAVGPSDVVVGTLKGFVFGALVAGLACLRGLQTKEGPEAVGDSATNAVVSGIVAIFLADGLFAVLTFVLGV